MNPSQFEKCQEDQRREAHTRARILRLMIMNPGAATLLTEFAHDVVEKVRRMSLRELLLEASNKDDEQTATDWAKAKLVELLATFPDGVL